MSDDLESGDVARSVLQSRRAGILLHPTSLPGAHGVGDLGDGAYRFVDFLAAAQQTIWQVLPLGPTGFGNSPYAARSAFAGSPVLISLDHLCGQGMLGERDLAGAPAFDPDRVAFEPAFTWKLQGLRLAYAFLQRQHSGEVTGRFIRFRAANAAWLDDFALFAALQEEHGGAAWTDWGTPLRLREAQALTEARGRLQDAIRFQQFVQWVFAEQWGELKRYANAHGVLIMGDLPIFVAQDSADVWANPELFNLDAGGRPAVVAGVPPDYFSATGQRWGNPLYRWDVIAAGGYRWWIERIRQALRQADVLRIDHFRGFEQYWEIPGDHQTAEHGRWQPGPGAALFEAIRAALGPVPLVAEDLGVITPAVDALRRGLGLPGMRVLQFAFGGDATSLYLPHNYDRDTVVYTGTHDNATTAGWWAGLGEADRGRVLTYLARDSADLVHDLIRLAYASVANTAIVPLQDVLNLGDAARMNTPGRPEGNWSWRYRVDALHDEDAHWLAALAETYGR